MKVTREQFVGVTYGELLAENDRLREENDKLREELEFVGHIAVSNVVASIGREESLEDENAKLRELVVRMFRTIEWNDRMNDSMYWPSFSYKRELRELGVEVGE